MKKLFREWNWEFDYGVDEVAPGGSLPPSYAVAFYDHRGRLYRVEERQRPETTGIEGDDAKVTSSYDYFCTLDGRVSQKRSLEEGGEVHVIVDMEYTDAEVTEVAWWPANNVCKSIRRRFKR